MNEKLISTIDQEVAAAIVAWLQATTGPVTIRLASSGGDPTAAITICNAIQKRGDVTCIADGQASSAASLILAAAQTTRAVAGAVFCLHAAWASVSGDAAALRALAEGLEAVTASMTAMYATRIKDTAEVSRLMASGDTWLDCDAAKACGLIDEVVQPGASQANVVSIAQPRGTTPVVINASDIQTRYQPRVDHNRLAAAGFCARMGFPVKDAERVNNPWASSAIDAPRLSHLEAKHRGEIVAAGPFLDGVDAFPNVLKDTSNKAIGFAFNALEEIYEAVCMPRRVRNFHPVTLASLGFFPPLPEIGEHGELQVMHRADTAEEAELKTFAGIYTLSRRAIVNDDLQALADSAAKMGEAAKRSLGDSLASILTTNGALADGVDLFHADHGNLGSTALSTTALDAAWTAFATQKDPSGRVISVRPRYAVVPASLYGKMNSTIDAEFAVGDTATGSDSTSPNLARGLLPLENVLYDGRLDDTSITHWFLFSAGCLAMLSLTDSMPVPMVGDMQMLLERDGYAGRCVVDGMPAVTGYQGAYRSGA